MASITEKVAFRYLVAYFKPEDYILYGKFKNKRGKIMRMWLDERGVPMIEIQPVPAGRKKNRIMGLYTIRKQDPTSAAVSEQMEKQASLVASGDADGFLAEFYRKFPKLRKFQPKVVEKTSGGGSGHPEARQHGDEIWLFPKFWRSDTKTQMHVFAHEIGHYALSRKGLVWLMNEASKHGVDVFDTDNLPFGQFNFEEAFAEAFASYFSTPGELKRRYPAWVKLVEAV